jgi:hypothetical protein
MPCWSAAHHRGWKRQKPPQHCQEACDAKTTSIQLSKPLLILHIMAAGCRQVQGGKSRTAKKLQATSSLKRDSTLQRNTTVKPGVQVMTVWHTGDVLNTKNHT